VSVPGSLRSPGLRALWDLVRERLEKVGIENRGRVPLPELLSPDRLALQAVLDRRLGAMVDLRVLEAALNRLGVGEDLPCALAALGHPISPEPAARRAQRADRRRAHAEARAAATAWPEAWASDWIDAVIRAGVLRGFDTAQVRVLIDHVRRVLDALERDQDIKRSRVDLAARVLGSAHALDAGTRLGAAVEHALRLRSDAYESAVRRELWEQAGVHLDLTSGPVLTWGMPLCKDTTLERLTSAASAAGIPLHLSRFALEQHPIRVPQDTRVLVVENPRVVEAAAQMRSRMPVLSTNGQPSSTVLLALEQLAESSAELYYHGDFDTPGLAICERIVSLALTPWRMYASDYRAALEAAELERAELPIDVNAPASTSWDPELRRVFDEERRIVHQERLLPGLIEGWLD